MTGIRIYKIVSKDQNNLVGNNKKVLSWILQNSENGEITISQEIINKISVVRKYSKSTVRTAIYQLISQGFITLKEKKVEYKRRVNLSLEPGTVEYCYASQLKHRYNLSYEKYLEMKKSQSNKCLICEADEKESKNGRLVVDHCHSTGKIRGLLCDKCNNGLGRFNDNIETLRSAINYLSENNLEN